MPNGIWLLSADDCSDRYLSKAEDLGLQAIWHRWWMVYGRLVLGRKHYSAFTSPTVQISKKVVETKSQGHSDLDTCRSPSFAEKWDQLKLIKILKCPLWSVSNGLPWLAIVPRSGCTSQTLVPNGQPVLTSQLDAVAADVAVAVTVAVAVAAVAVSYTLKYLKRFKK